MRFYVNLKELKDTRAAKKIVWEYVKKESKRVRSLAIRYESAYLLLYLMLKLFLVIYQGGVKDIDTHKMLDTIALISIGLVIVVAFLALVMMNSIVYKRYSKSEPAYIDFLEDRIQILDVKQEEVLTVVAYNTISLVEEKSSGLLVHFSPVSDIQKNSIIMTRGKRGKDKKIEYQESVLLLTSEMLKTNRTEVVELLNRKQSQ